MDNLTAVLIVVHILVSIALVALVLLDWTEATLFTRVGISTVVFMSLYIETSIFYFSLKENLRS